MTEIADHPPIYPIKYIQVGDEFFYYLDDIAKMLGVDYPHNSIKKFDSTEILSAEKRRQLNIVSYRIYDSKCRRDNTVILLTKFGLIRIIACSKSQLYQKNKDYFNRLIILAAADSIPGVDFTNGGNRSENIELIQAAHIGAAEDSREIMNSLYECIYVIAESPYQSRVKIGKTNDLTKRLQTLQTGNPNSLFVYSCKYCPRLENVEGYLHAKYEDRRIYHDNSSSGKCGMSEWFHFSWDELKLVMD